MCLDYLCSESQQLQLVITGGMRGRGDRREMTFVGSKGRGRREKKDSQEKTGEEIGKEGGVAEGKRGNSAVEGIDVPHAIYTTLNYPTAV